MNLTRNEQVLKSGVSKLKKHADDPKQSSLPRTFVFIIIGVLLFGLIYNPILQTRIITVENNINEKDSGNEFGDNEFDDF